MDGVAGTGPERAGAPTSTAARVSAGSNARAGARGDSAAGAWRARVPWTVVRGSGASVRVGSSVSAACLPVGFVATLAASPKVTSTCPTLTV